MNRTALIMTGGTGGHIFPALAVADELRQRGWTVVFLGAEGGMETRLVPARGYPLKTLAIRGVRGNGVRRWLLMPLMLVRAVLKSLALQFGVRPDVVVGFGGYTGAPGGLAARLLWKPLVIHEQNSVAGLTNRVLSHIATRTLFAFPGAFAGKVGLVGNPVRTDIAALPAPESRFAGRCGPLRLLVVGGSLGAQALNDIVPRALALIPAENRPVVTHQSGATQIDTLRANYQAAGVQAELTPFIDDTASAFAAADIIVCRAGASTVTEIAAVGAAAIFVPFPFAVDDHQTTNARFLVNAGGGWLVQQSDLTPEGLAKMLLNSERTALVDIAEKAKNMQKINATREVVAACEELSA